MRRVEICSRRLMDRRFVTARVEARVSRQPWLPQRQTGPSSVDDGVADLAGGAADAVREAAAGDEPAADAGGDL